MFSINRLFKGGQQLKNVNVWNICSHHREDDDDSDNNDDGNDNNDWCESKSWLQHRSLKILLTPFFLL